jgi:glycosyltransferase involved in cell wall biosynthesis
MKVAAIFYHKNISSLYREDWIEKSFKSVLNQTFKKFTIYELNYGKDDLKLCEKYSNKKKSHYFNIEMDNHAQAMNFLIENCLKDGFDIIFNNNLDDISNEKRFELQINEIKRGYDIVSSNFIHIDSEDDEIRKMDFSKIDIKEQFNLGHNVLCHPSICYTKKFLEKNRYISDEIPEEDFKLWKRTLSDYKFYIHPEYLIKYRIHNNQITSISNTESIKEEIKKIESVETKVKIQPQIIHNTFNIIDRCRFCGEPKNKVKYNFCQKCNKLY